MGLWGLNSLWAWIDTNTSNLILKPTYPHVYDLLRFSLQWQHLIWAPWRYFSDCCTLVIQPLRPLIANSVSLIKVQNYSSLFKPSKHISRCPLCKKKKMLWADWVFSIFKAYCLYFCVVPLACEISSQYLYWVFPQVSVSVCKSRVNIYIKLVKGVILF